MKRKMVYIGLPVLLGLLFASFLSTAYDYIAVPFVVLAMIFLKYPVKMKNIEIIVCIIAFTTGFSSYRINENFVYQKIINYSNQIVEFNGRIMNISEYAGDKASYILKGEINGIKNAEILYYGDAVNCQYGDEINLICTLEELENSYTFNTADYYKSMGIFLQVKDTESVQILNKDGFHFIRAVWNYRNKIYKRIMSIAPYDEGNLISAMLFGSKIADIDDNMRTALYRLGIGHVFAVSGFHLMIMATMIKILLRNLHSGKMISFIFISFSTLIFIVCSGFSMSAIRAGIMIVISCSAILLLRNDDALNSLCIAITAMTLFNPFIVRNPSFLLSVSGFFAIGVFAPFMTQNMPENTKLKKLFKNFIAFLCMSMVLIPVSSLFFNETSIISAVVNILLMPLVSFILILGMIVFITGGVGFIAYPLLKISSVLCGFIIDIAEYTASLKFVKIPLGYDFIRIISFILMVFVCISFAIFKSRQSIGFSLILSLLIILGSTVFYQSVSKDILNITAFGKDSVELLIINHGKSTDIIDISGGRKNPNYAETYMQKYGVDSVNNIVITSNPYQCISNYNNKFKWYDINCFYLPVNTYVLKNSYICGCVPQYYDMGRIYIEYDDYTLVVDTENASVYISYRNFFIKCSENLIVYKNQIEVFNSNLDEYIIFKTDGIDKAEFVR